MVGKNTERHAALFLDPVTKTAYVDEKNIELTNQEFELLVILAQNAPNPVSRRNLLYFAWGYIGSGRTRTVDVHIQRLRKKLGSCYIETVYREGYQLLAEEAPPDT